MHTRRCRRAFPSASIVCILLVTSACGAESDPAASAAAGAMNFPQGGALAGGIGGAGTPPAGGQGVSGTPSSAMGGTSPSAGTGGSAGAAGSVALGGSPSAGASGSGVAGGGVSGTNTGGTSLVAGAGGSSVAGTAGTGATGGAGSAGAPAAGSGGGGTDPALAKFSFFVTSYPAMKSLSGSASGFGGDLRFGKADGLSGADEICRQVAELGMPGAGQKQWRAFLSATSGPGGEPVNARDRIGAGPWYDRQGRLVANSVEDLFSGVRPAGDPDIVADLPTERGEPNHYVGPNGLQAMVVDNHDTLTGSDATGRLRASSSADTCNDWTSTTATGRPWIGHSWPRSATSGRNWVSDHQVPGCAAGIDRTLGGSGTGTCVGCSGGHGGFYCFALP